MTYIWITLGVAVITCLLLYLDGRLFDRPKKRIVYIKTIIMTVGLVLLTLVFLSWLSPTKNPADVIQMGGKIRPKITGGPTVLIPEIGEEMFMGDAKF